MARAVQDVAKRAFAALTRVEDWLAADRARCAIVVAHNHVNRLRLCHLLGWPMREYRDRLVQDPGAYNLITLGGEHAGHPASERAGGLMRRRSDRQGSVASVNPYNPWSESTELHSTPQVREVPLSIELSQQLQPVMQAKVTPKQIAANYILQMSSVELQEAIAQELDENPALEMEELPSCPICGRPVSGNYCTECMPRKARGRWRRESPQHRRPAR